MKLKLISYSFGLAAQKFTESDITGKEGILIRGDVFSAWVTPM
jgi:hypothetical protein